MSRRLLRGHPAREGAAEAEQSSPAEPRVLSGRCQGAAGWGGEGRKGGGDGIPPSRKSFSGGGARPTPSSVLQTAEPGSRRPHRQRGAPQRPPHRPLGPRGPETLAARARGPDTPPGLPQLPGEHTGTPESPAALGGCKIHPPGSPPQPALFPRPQRSTTAGEKPPASRGQWPLRPPDLLPRLPVRTPTRI